MHHMTAARVSHAALPEGAGGLLPEELSGLLSPHAYPHPVESVAVIETPLSWVLLAGAFAYKIKRPVRYPFVDQRMLQYRRWLCEEELRLNRRFAPQLYLAVCRIEAAGTHLRVRCGSTAAHEVLEYAVRMQRFDAADELDQRLAEGRLPLEALASFGRSLADIHATLPSVTAESPWGRPEHVHTLLAQNLRECAAAASVFARGEAVSGLETALEQRLAESSSAMALRQASGRVRECHGDLHSRNIIVREGHLVPFDCLEYERAFRWIDVADEIAFLASDLFSRGHRRHAHAFLAAYLQRCGDYHACRVIRLYEAHRALVRAKVAALSAAARPEAHRSVLRAQFERLVSHAAAALAARRPQLVLMSGLSGSGKTWIARQLTERLEAVHLRSDVERKRLAGLDLQQSSGSGLAAGLYAPEVSERVYAELARETYDALIGGYTVIVDATFLRRVQRQYFETLGARAQASTYWVRCIAPLAVLQERLRARAAEGHDSSEADAAVLDWQRQQLERAGADETSASIEIESTDPQGIQKILTLISAASSSAASLSRSVARLPQ